MKKKFRAFALALGAALLMAPGANAVAANVAIDATNFPDEYFRNYVATLDTNNNNNLDDDEIAGVKEIELAQATYENTQSLKGIEKFYNLERLTCSDLKLTDLDVTALGKLKYLDCSKNSIQSLNLSQNTLLEALDCSTNELTTLLVENNTALKALWCGHNKISALNLTTNTKLTSLRFNDTKISNITLTHLTELEDLDCGATALTTVPISGTTQKKLQRLCCYGLKGLTTLSVTGYPELTYIDCSGTELRSLDASNNSKLEILVCYGMKDIPVSQFTNDYNDCVMTLRSDDMLYMKSIGGITALNVSGDTALKLIDCSYNKMTELDVSGCTALTYLDISKNKFSAIDVEKNTALQLFYCGSNSLTELNVESNTALVDLNCYENELEILDLKNHPNLIKLDCGKNHLTALDVTKCSGEIQASCSGNVYEITLDKYYEYNLLNLPGKRFTQGNADDLENTNKKALYVYGQSQDALINGYQFVPILNQDKLTYEYYIGKQSSAKAKVKFTLKIKNPLKVAVNFATGGSSPITTVAEEKKSLLKGQSATFSVINPDTMEAIPSVTLSTDNKDCVEINNNTKTLTALSPTPEGSPAKIQIWINNTAKAWVNVEVQQPVTGITLSETEKEMFTDETFQLQPEISPANATNKKVTWFVPVGSSVVRVDKKGNVTALGVGYAEVKCKAADGSGVESDACCITVKQGVTDFSLQNTYGKNITTKNLISGDIYQLSAVVSPETVEDKTVTWASSNSSIVSVNEKGEIEAKNAGTATITCYPNAKPDMVKTCTITVLESSYPVTLNYNEYEFTREKESHYPTVQLEATSTDEGFTKNMVEWYSEDEAVAEVNVSTGKVKAMKAGATTILCQIGNTKVAQCEVTVKQWPTKIVVSVPQKLVEGQQVQATASFLPEDTTNKNVQWISTDPDVLAIDAQGRVTAKKQGDAYIYCVATDGSQRESKSVSVKVTKPVQRITLSSETGNKVFVKKKIYLAAAILPADATNQKLTWKSSNSSVATVSSGGTVYGVKVGTVVITATATDGSGVKATYTVVVQQPVEKLSLNTTYKVVKRGKTVKLKPVIAPKNASVKKVKWTSSDRKIATVSSSGKVTVKKKAKAGSTVTITCTTTDGTNRSVNCDIVVGTPVTKITLNKSKVTIKRRKSYKLIAKVRPTKATDSRVEWTSSNPKVATVSSSGVVTAIKKGKTTITCKAKDGSGKKKTCKVTVKK